MPSDPEIEAAAERTVSEDPQAAQRSGPAAGQHRAGPAVDIELTEAHGHAQRGASRRVRRGGDAPATTLPRVAEERSVGAGA